MRHRGNHTSSRPTGSNLPHRSAMVLSPRHPRLLVHYCRSSRWYERYLSSLAGAAVKPAARIKGLHPPLGFAGAQGGAGGGPGVHGGALSTCRQLAAFCPQPFLLLSPHSLATLTWIRFLNNILKKILRGEIAPARCSCIKRFAQAIAQVG